MTVVGSFVHWGSYCRANTDLAFKKLDDFHQFKHLKTYEACLS